MVLAKHVADRRRGFSIWRQQIGPQGHSCLRLTDQCAPETVSTQHIARIFITNFFNRKRTLIVLFWTNFDMESTVDVPWIYCSYIMLTARNNYSIPVCILWSVSECNVHYTSYATGNYRLLSFFVYCVAKQCKTQRSGICLSLNVLILPSSL